MSFALRGPSLKLVPYGAACAMWTGIGAAGAALVGIFLVGESADWERIGCLVLTAAGAIGLRFVTPA